MADFYGTATAFVNYHAERDNTIPADIDTDAERETALLIASEWLDARYKSLFENLKTGGRDQVREWPRVGHTDRYAYVIPDDEIPREVEYATYEIALIWLNDADSLRIDYTPSKYKQASVDGAVSATFAEFTSSSEMQTQFQIVSEIMNGLFYSDGNVDSGLSGSVERA